MGGAERNLRHVMVSPRDADVVGVDIEKRLVLDPGHDSVSRCGGAKVYEWSTVMGSAIGGRTVPVVRDRHFALPRLVLCLGRAQHLLSFRQKQREGAAGSVCTAIS